MPVVSNDFSDIVYNRRSIRNFDPSVKIPREELLEILDKTVTAPSSVNMQPWRFVVVESEEGKEKLTPFVSYNVVQNETSSAMVLIFADLKSQERAEDIYGKAVAQGKMPEEVKEKQLSSIVPMYENAPRDVMNEIVHIDASLAAMQLCWSLVLMVTILMPLVAIKKKVSPKPLDLMKTVMYQFCSLLLGKPMKKALSLFVWMPLM